MFLEDLTPRIVQCRNGSAVTTIPESLWLEVIQRKYKTTTSNAEPGVAAASSNLEPKLMPKIRPAEAAKGKLKMIDLFYLLKSSNICKFI